MEGGVVREERVVGLCVHVEPVLEGLRCVPAFKVGCELLGDGAAVSMDVLCGRIGEGGEIIVGRQTV